ncbi:hypothetical protein EON65_27835 [archaeon]|nr:MAG: hypothetical protein EON65_27835 [archaeon]
MISLKSLFGYILVSILWGCSNPFIKHGQALQNRSNSQDLDEDPQKKTNKGLFGSIKNMIQNKTVLIPFIVNQSGSLVFYVLLSSEPVSVASPVVNSLTFVVTAVTSYVLFNEVVRYPSMLIIGSVLILLGTSLCMLT